MSTPTRPSVLVVDDEPDIHAFVRAALEEVDCQVVTASDGEEGLERVRADSPDLVILDVQMPKKGGFSVFQELRADEATKAIPVIMLTAVSQQVGMSYGAGDMGDFYGRSPEAFIDKPVDPATLRETVRKLLDATGGS